MFRICFIFFLIVSLLSPSTIFAITDPLAQPNNKIGIHILDDFELSEAAKLINSNGGDWGYVTIPITINDTNYEKWQTFMKNCKTFHIIPILRLATEGEQTNSGIWREGTRADIVKLAEFLATLNWPIKNRYIIVFNEVNRSDEWGGKINPAEYAEILSFTTTIFKSKNPDFFIISAGLDNAAPNQGSKFMDEYEYMKNMQLEIPGIFNQIDGLASHSYPNPGFSQPPATDSARGVSSFRYERALAESLSNKKLPVFITETGWSGETIPDKKRAEYYTETFQTIWNDPGIVAITPFLFEAKYGPFQKFSFLTNTDTETQQYQAVKTLAKIQGDPAQPVTPATNVLAAETKRPPKKQKSSGLSFINMIKEIITSLIQ